MKRFNTEEFGNKIEAVEKEIGTKIDYYLNKETKNELIKYISTELKNALLDKDLTKVLAIIDYITHNSEISGNDLPITHEVNGTISLYDSANSIGECELATELVGLCKALHYIDAE